MRDGGVDAGMDHGRMSAAVGGSEFPGERAVGIARVPIPSLGQHQTLGYLEAERMNIADINQHAREFLAALHDAELRCLLDRVDGIAAGIREPDDLRLRGL